MSMTLRLMVTIPSVDCRVATTMIGESAPSFCNVISMNSHYRTGVDARAPLPGPQMGMQPWPGVTPGYWRYAAAAQGCHLVPRLKRCTQRCMPIFHAASVFDIESSSYQTAF